jgi:hypothetical protein
MQMAKRRWCVENVGKLARYKWPPMDILQAGSFSTGIPMGARQSQEQLCSGALARSFADSILNRHFGAGHSMPAVSLSMSQFHGPGMSAPQFTIALPNPNGVIGNERKEIFQMKISEEQRRLLLKIARQELSKMCFKLQMDSDPLGADGHEVFPINFGGFNFLIRNVLCSCEPDARTDLEVAFKK